MTGLVVGLLLWLFGWRWHRFWTVVAVTVAGGLYGLSTGQATGAGTSSPSACLLAISAGLLALELARLFAFVAGGTAAWLVAGAFFPNGQELGVFFLVGGLAGILLYRLWTMALDQFRRHAGRRACGAHPGRYAVRFDAVGWAGRNPVALSIGVGLISLLGLAVQGAQVRRRGESDAKWKPNPTRVPKTAVATRSAATACTPGPEKLRDTLQQPTTD